MSETQDKIRSVASFLYSFLDDGPDYYTGDFSSQSAYDKAERDELEVVLPRDNQLFIDIDSDFALLVFEKNYEQLLRFYDSAAITSISPSKSGGEKKHITITLSEPVSPTERLVLQAFLGSDLRREFLGLQRIKAGDKNPTLFLEKKN